MAFLLVTFSWLFRGFFVALFCLEKQCSGLFRYFFVAFSWLFRGGQILRVLALEQSSDSLRYTHCKILRGARGVRHIRSEDFPAIGLRTGTARHRGASRTGTPSLEADNFLGAYGSDAPVAISPSRESVGSTPLTK